MPPSSLQLPESAGQDHLVLNVVTPANLHVFRVGKPEGRHLLQRPKPAQIYGAAFLRVVTGSGASPTGAVAVSGEGGRLTP